MISDRAADAAHAPIPMLLAIGAVRQHLVHTGLRARVGLVAEAGDAFDIHHFATLIGYGAEAMHPWLALATMDGLFGEDREPSRREREADGSAAPVTGGGARSYRSRRRRACSRSSRRWGSRRSRSYCGAQIFEVLGLGHEVIATCFAGTASPIGGIGFEEIAEDVLARHRAAYPRTPSRARVAARSRPGALPEGGGGSRWSPPVVVALQQAVKATGTPRRTAAFW